MHIYWSDNTFIWSNLYLYWYHPLYSYTYLLGLTTDTYNDISYSFDDCYIQIY